MAGGRTYLIFTKTPILIALVLKINEVFPGKCAYSSLLPQPTPYRSLLSPKNMLSYHLYPSFSRSCALAKSVEDRTRQTETLMGEKLCRIEYKKIYREAN